MTIYPTSTKRRGFTLMELMVAMAITGVIVAVLVSITGTAIDTWNRGRSELRAARQAKAMVDVMANDLESLVTRTGNSSEWLAAISNIPDGGSTNAAQFVFFTAATDRYDGQIGVDGVDNHGDVSCAGYELQWADPVGTGTGTQFQTFVLKRMLVDPDVTFDALLGSADADNPLEDLFFESGLPATNSRNESLDIDENRYFLCENIFQFTLVFHVEVYEDDGSGNLVLRNRLVTISSDSSGSSKEEFRMRGDGNDFDPINAGSREDQALATGTVTAVEVSLSVIKDSAINTLRSNQVLATDDAWLSKNTYHYSRLIQLPRM